MANCSAAFELAKNNPKLTPMALQSTQACTSLICLCGAETPSRLNVTATLVSANNLGDGYGAQPQGLEFRHRQQCR
jgi:hypothetical protein